MQTRRLGALALGMALAGASAGAGAVTFTPFAFDSHARRDLFVPALFSRGMGNLMAALLTSCRAASAGSEGIEEVALHVAGKHSLVFLISDFHWPVERLSGVLEMLAASHVVPMVIWDPAELQPPASDALLPLQDMETGAHRTIWMRPRLRARWTEAVEERRTQIVEACAPLGARPFFVSGKFDSDAMSRYFLESVA